MKAFKIILKTLLALVAIVMVLLLALPLWIGPVAKTVANSLVPKYTGTAFSIGKFEFNPYVGHLELGDMHLANPEGYSPDDAVDLGLLRVEYEPKSVFTDRIVVKEIVLSEAFVSYIKKSGVYNFDTIGENCKKASGGDKREETTEVAAAEEPAQTNSSKKVVIDCVTISGTKVRWNVLTLPVPTITVRDIGKESDGVSLDVAWTELSDAVMQVVLKATSIGGNLKDLGTNGVQSATEAVQGAADAAKDAGKMFQGAGSSLKDAGKSLKETGKSLKNLFK